MSIYKDGGAPPWAHKADPNTSKVAARKARGTASAHRALILETIKRASGQPLACEQIARTTGLNELQVMKRVSELKNDAQIVAKDELHTNASGRAASRYVLAACAEREIA